MAQYRVSRVSYYKHLVLNALQSVLLIAIMSLLLSTCAFILFGQDGFIVALVVTAAACLFTPSISPRLIMSVAKKG